MENEKIFDVSGIENKLDELAKLCQQLRQENRILRSSERVWKQERAVLVEKNELARTKIESMISRLKTLE